jgi:hypothetical protein
MKTLLNVRDRGEVLSRLAKVRANAQPRWGMSVHQMRMAAIESKMEIKDPGGERVSSKGYPFSGRLYIYHEQEFSHKQLGELQDVYAH